MRDAGETDPAAAFRAICRARGWKFTAQRYAVYRFMCGNRRHPTADAVREALRADFPSISRDSVFRILNDLAEAGVIARMAFTDPVRFDGEASRHDHFFCRGCGDVIDFDAGVSGGQVPDTVGAVHSVELRAAGICRRCRTRQGGA